MVTRRGPRHDEPCYIISVAAKLVNLHPQTLRYYERLGLVKPARSEGGVRLYSPRDIERLRKIVRLTEDLGVNLAGVEVILHMRERMEQMQREMEQMQAQFERLQRYVQAQMEGSEEIETVKIPVTVKGKEETASAGDKRTQ
ncbi:MAG: heat shock protein transcriptional repressor HspR [Anaerolineae bacterium]